MTNTDLQNTTQKTKDRSTLTLLKTGVNSGAPEGRAIPLHTWIQFSKSVRYETYILSGFKKYD